MLVGIDEVYKILPYDLQAKEIIFGAVAVRAQVVLKYYGFDGTKDFPIKVGHIKKLKHFLQYLSIIMRLASHRIYNNSLKQRIVILI